MEAERLSLKIAENGRSFSDVRKKGRLNEKG